MTQEEFLRFQLDFHKWTTHDLARFAGIKSKEAEALVQGKELRDTESRTKVSRCLGINPEIWHRL